MTASIPMTNHSISEDAVRRELWVSFASLVRAYVAAAQIAGSPQGVLVMEHNGRELELVSATRSVKVILEPGRTAGHWAIYRAPVLIDDLPLADGAFRIGLDSLIEWTGLPGRQEMDAVAEALATLVLEDSV